MSNIPQKSDSDDLFSHLLDYQQTEEYKEAAQAQMDKHRQYRRAVNLKGARVYRERHPELVAMRGQAKKYKTRLYEKQKGLCRWCGEPLTDDYEIDHIVALINGGTNALKNLCVCHPHCNRVKRAR